MVLGISLFGCAVAAENPPVPSTGNDRTSVELTVYNSSIGLVKETRKVTLQKGQGRLLFAEVPKTIQPESVRVQSKGGGFKIIEQNYKYDLSDPNQVLERFEGQKIKLVNWNAYQDRKEETEATLLSAQSQIFDINGEIYLGHPGYKVVPFMPEGLAAKPALIWTYASDTAESREIEVYYLASGIGWDADYSLVVEADEKSAELEGWATVRNQSGASFADASLKLVAGSVNRAPQMYTRKARMELAEAPMPMDAAGSFEAGGLSEYHVYDLKQKTTLEDQQDKQLSFLEKAAPAVEKEYQTQGQQYFFMQYWIDQTKQPVGVYFKFKNSDENHLGIPLPQGTVRIYQKDAKGQRFIGEDRIGHTPKDEEVRLKVGDAFDITAERTQTDYKELSTKLRESEWEIVLKNRKDQDVKVVVLEPFQQNWNIVESTHPHTKKDAFTGRFEIDVPKNGEARLKYRVRVGI